MPSLPTRKIGNDDVTAIGLGLMGLSVFYGPVESDEERFKVRTNESISSLKSPDDKSSLGRCSMLHLKQVARIGTLRTSMATARIS